MAPRAQEPVSHPVVIVLSGPIGDSRAISPNSETRAPRLPSTPFLLLASEYTGLETYPTSLVGCLQCPYWTILNHARQPVWAASEPPSVAASPVYARQDIDPADRTQAPDLPAHLEELTT
jgi:hypothetical protein